jgi:putative transposase
LQTYHLVKCVKGRRPLLADPQSAEMIIGSVQHARRHQEIKLRGFVIMPDHYHVVLTLLEVIDLSPLMRRIGSFTANEIRKRSKIRGAVWQDGGFFDHLCRSEKENGEIIEYIHHNPVRRQLVSAAEDWPDSSAHPDRKHLLDWD